jgi:hypothetical protein
MSVSLSPWLKPRFFITGTNRPLAGGLMYTYEAGTTTNATTYSDDSGTPNANPIVLNSDGECNLYLDDDVIYRIILKNAAGVTQFDKDNIAGNGAKDAAVLSFENVANLRLAIGNDREPTAQTNGYYNAGDGGGNSFYWDGTSSATDNGGTIIKPTLVSGAGRWIATTDIITLEMFGAVLNGVADDSTAFAAAINASVGREIEIKTGKICKINTAQSFSVGFRLCGGGTILINVPTGQTAIAVSGAVRLDNIILDGNSVSNELIRCTGSKLEIYGGEVKNIYRATPTDNVTGIQTIGVDFLRIKDVVFSKICGGSNGTIGDSAGAVAAVQISSSCANGRITNCTFDDINNRLASITGTLQYEDADAVRCFSTSGNQNVKIEGCYFTNIGKRAAKFLGTSSSVYGFDDNDCLSAYTGTVDDAVTLGNGMFSMASCYSGYFSADRNRFNGGVTSYIFDCDTADLRSVRVTNTVNNCEYHKRANTTLTTFLRSGTTTPASVTLYANGNYSKNTYYGVQSYAKYNNISDNPLLECGSTCLDVQSGGVAVFNNNYCPHSASTDATTEAAYGVILRNGLTVSSCVGNIMIGKYDGFYIISQSGAFRSVIAGNALNATVRLDFNYDVAQLASITFLANQQSTAAMGNSLQAETTLGATGGAATALPALPVGYIRIFTNGTNRKIPYYAT